MDFLTNKMYYIHINNNLWSRKMANSDFRKTFSDEIAATHEILNEITDNTPNKEQSADIKNRVDAMLSEKLGTRLLEPSQVAPMKVAVLSAVSEDLSSKFSLKAGPKEHSETRHSGDLSKFFEGTARKNDVLSMLKKETKQQIGMEGVSGGQTTGTPTRSNSPGKGQVGDITR